MKRLGSCARFLVKVVPAVVCAGTTLHTAAFVAAPEPPSLHILQQRSLGQDSPTAAVHGQAIRPLRIGDAPLADLTIEEAVLQSVEWNPDIAAAIGRLYAQGEEIDIAHAGYYPRVRGGMNSEYDNNESDRRIHRLSLSATQMLYDFGKVDSAVDAARAGLDVSRARTLLAIDTVARDAAQALIEIQRYQTAGQVAQAQVKGVSAIRDLAGHRTALGAGTRSDLIQAESRVQAAQATALEIQAQLDRWKNVLAALMAGRHIASAAEGVPIQLNQACTAGEPQWELAPAILLAEAQRAESLARIDQAKADAWPTLSLEAGTGRVLNTVDRNRNDFTVTVNVTTSLYEGGAIAARRQAAAYALSAANAARDAARLSARQGLLEAREQTRSLAQRMAILDERDLSIRETRDLYRHQYLSLGTRTLLDLLNAEQELHQARFERLNTLYDLRTLYVDCLFNAGMMREAFSLNARTIQGMELRP